ncbi:MAG: sigma-54-dependent Fis family transcriptional regulator [Alphaproteobacteria bacterium]|nr:sigma-54-dependent Fis family transcriptional regulator [Alphaproteobacteria bacterium]MCB9695693.1 sigma-54-dependent Fis family transcriptional regulator [Alphaproteobacteria bacterium]
MSDRILVVDDEAVLRSNLVRFLDRTGHEVEGVASAEEALQRLDATDFAVVITDLKMPGMGGEALLRRVTAEHPETLVLVITAFASLESAIEALRHGAQDYLLKPLSLDEVTRKVDRLLDVRELEHRVARLRREVHQRFDTEGMVADSPSMQRVLELVRKAAGSRSSVLVEGESGTGKELVARALHDQSPWADRDFIAVNLAAQPRDLVDATLFGHEKGAFTGAARGRDGVFRAARGGTVFLDEISEMPPEVQVKLLRVLENREVLPLGADRPVPVDFRLVAATNKPLRAEVDAGRFREDLFFRVEILKVELPPLRERPDDIPALARRFLARHAEKQRRNPPRIGHKVMRRLQTYAWPGNVRELSNVIERAVLLCDGEWIETDDLPSDLSGTQPPPDVLDLKAAMAEFERRHIERVLAHCDGDKNLTAERLGVHLATLYRHMERLGLG